MLQHSDSSAPVLEPVPVVPAEGVEVEPDFLQHILSPYAAKDCIYLKSARNFFGSTISTRAKFSIPESCYIDSTGHFNAVELNICYNQMFYVLMADAILRRQVPELAGWSNEDFKQQQLPAMLIVRVNSEFRAPINPREFSGEAIVDRVRFLGKGPRPKMYVRTHATFQDASGGLAKAQIDFAIVPSL
jgi:FcoT-like thioesterase domain